MICDIPPLFQKWNSHATYMNPSTVTIQNPFPQLSKFCANQLRELLTSQDHQLCRNTCPNYIQKQTFEDIYLNIFFSSKPVSGAIIRMSKQCLDVCRQCI